MKKGWYFLKKDEIKAFFIALCAFEKTVMPANGSSVYIDSKTPEELQDAYKKL